MGESAEGRGAPDGGVCGTVAWSLYANGDLVFSPLPGHAEGEFAPDLGRDDPEGEDPAWTEGADLVRRVCFDGLCRASGSVAGMFCGLANAEAIDLSLLDTSTVTDMSYMFWGCGSLWSPDLTGLDTSSARKMERMFEDCSSLRSLDLSGLDTSRVVDMSFMFDGCSSLRSLDLSGLDTSRVTSMWGMFRGCRSLRSLDLSGLDTSRVEDTKDCI